MQNAFDTIMFVFQCTHLIVLFFKVCCLYLFVFKFLYTSSFVVITSACVKLTFLHYIAMSNNITNQSKNNTLTHD